MSEPLQPVADDYRRAQMFRRKAEAFHNQWLAGCDSETALVTARARAGDRRFRGMGAKELRAVGRLRWSRSTTAQKLASREEKYMRRAQLYLASADTQLLLLSNSRPTTRLPR